MGTAEPVFDKLERIEKRHRYFNESFFAYYNMSARPGFVAIREVIERWYAEFPAKGKTDIRGRLRSGKDTNFLSAFFELYLCQLCKRSGFDVAIYPGMKDHSRESHPDFLVLRDGNPVFYLEATLAQESQSTTAAKRRQAALEDTINRLHSPNFWLMLDTSGAAADNIPVTKVQKKLQKWLEGLNVEQAMKDQEKKGDAALPTFTDSYWGLTITITAYPKSPDNRGDPRNPALGAVMPDELLEWNTNVDIREAVLRKANCYGDLQLPYIVAINVINELYDFDDVLDALFGMTCPHFPHSCDYESG